LRENKYPEKQNERDPVSYDVGEAVR